MMPHWQGGHVSSLLLWAGSATGVIAFCFAQKPSNMEQLMIWTSQGAAWVCSPLPGPTWVCRSDASIAWPRGLKHLGLCVCPNAGFYHLYSGSETHNHNLMLLTSSCVCCQSLRSVWSAGILGTGSTGSAASGQGTHSQPGRAALLTRSLLETVLEQCDLVRQSIAEHSCHQIPVWVSRRQPAPLEWREPVCHQTDVESFGRLCCWQEVIYWDAHPGPSQTEPAEANGSGYRSGLNAARSVLPAMAAAVCQLLVQEHSEAAFEGTDPSPSEAQAALGVQCLPGIPDCVLSHPPLGQMSFFTLGSNVLFRIFWARWRKINSLSSKRARYSFFAALESRCREGFSPALLPSPWGTCSVPPSPPPDPWHTWPGPASTLGASSVQ